MISRTQHIVIYPFIKLRATWRETLELLLLYNNPQPAAASQTPISTLVPMSQSQSQVNRETTRTILRQRPTKHILFAISGDRNSSVGIFSYSNPIILSFITSVCWPRQRPQSDSVSVSKARSVHMASSAWRAQHRCGSHSPKEM